MNTYQQHSVQAFLDFSITGSFINEKFVQMYWINTQKISQPIIMFNIDGTANKAGQILKAINMVL